jgi:hypothetical protein
MGKRRERDGTKSFADNRKTVAKCCKIPDAKTIALLALAGVTVDESSPLDCCDPRASGG